MSLHILRHECQQKTHQKACHQKLLNGRVYITGQYQTQKLNETNITQTKTVNHRKWAKSPTNRCTVLRMKRLLTCHEITQKPKTSQHEHTRKLGGSQRLRLLPLFEVGALNPNPNPYIYVRQIYSGQHVPNYITISQVCRLYIQIETFWYVFIGSQCR